MSINLATTWYPRGEMPRFVQLLPVFQEKYGHITISFFPGDDPEVMEQFTSGIFSSNQNLTFCVNDDKRKGRYMALKKAIEIPLDFIHYVDMDRLLHWVETRPEEWMQMIGQTEKFDRIIFGRTQAATIAHPQGLIATEKVSNQVVSHFLNREME
jgi:hypothetical protein